MLNLVFTFLQLNKKTLFTQSTLQIYQINEYSANKDFDINKKKLKMIDLKDFGLLESPRSKEEQLCVNYECEKR